MSLLTPSSSLKTKLLTFLLMISTPYISALEKNITRPNIINQLPDAKWTKEQDIVYVFKWQELSNIEKINTSLFSASIFSYSPNPSFDPMQPVSVFNAPQIMVCEFKDVNNTGADFHCWDRVFYYENDIDALAYWPNSPDFVPMPVIWPVFPNGIRTFYVELPLIPNMGEVTVNSNAIWFPCDILGKFTPPATLPTLPVNFWNIEITQNIGNEVNVERTVNSELNVDRYEIEYSLDGTARQTVGEVSSNTENAPKKYSFLHQNYTRGKVAYRIKNIDKNSGHSYSKTEEIILTWDESLKPMSENPVQSGKDITFSRWEFEGAARIFDARWNLIDTKRISDTDGDSITIQTTWFKPGTYIVSFSWNASKQMKVMVN